MRDAVMDMGRLQQRLDFGMHRCDGQNYRQCKHEQYKPPHDQAYGPPFSTHARELRQCLNQVNPSIG